MKDALSKVLSLGLGLAAAGKEQIEKTIDELVKKGEVSKEESKAWVEAIVQKGDEARQRIEELARDKVNAMIRERQLATREDIERLEKRIEELERKAQADG